MLWRLSRAARDYALKDKSLDKTRKKELHYESFEFAKRALNVDQENFGSHKWFAITIGDIGDYEGTKTKIKNSFLIKEHYEVYIASFYVKYVFLNWMLNIYLNSFLY